jgi:flagellar biosynthetic protein FliQ
VVALEVALPVLGAVVAAGFVVSALQSALRQSDPTVSVVPRLLAAGGALLIFGGWMMAVLSGFVVRLWSSVPEMMR